VPRAAAADAIREVRARGARTLLISGDTRRTVEAIAKRLGIDEVRAEVWPEAKAKIVAELQERGHRVAMVGDGVNDAPALARADLGIAIGSGTDVAIAAAEIVLVGGDPRGVPRALRLARRTVATIRQNLFWAFFYNVALIPATATPASSPAASAAGSPAMTPDAGAVKLVEFPVGPGQGPHDVAPAPDGGVWYTAQRTGELGYLDPKTGATRMVKLGSGSAPH